MNEILDWEQVTSSPSPSPPSSSSPFFSSNKYPPPFHDDSSIVFPPSRHEGLHMHDQELHPKPNVGDPPIPPCPFHLQFPGREAARCRPLLLGFQVFCSRLLVWVNYLSFLSRRVIRSVSASGAAASAAGIVGLLFLLGLRRRWRAAVTKRDSARLLIREMDQKINQLLHQVAQMNELLTAQHKVRVLKTA